MREATLYTLNAETVLAGDVVEFADQSIMDFDRLNRVHAEPSDMIYRKVSAPIHRITRIKKGEHVDSYIAMAPDLAEIMRAPFVAELNDAERKRKLAECNEEAARWIISAFLAQPLWKRIWLAIRG